MGQALYWANPFHSSSSAADAIVVPKRQQEFRCECERWFREPMGPVGFRGATGRTGRPELDETATGLSTTVCFVKTPDRAFCNELYLRNPCHMPQALWKLCCDYVLGESCICESYVLPSHPFGFQYLRTRIFIALRFNGVHLMFDPQFVVCHSFQRAITVDYKFDLQAGFHPFIIESFPGERELRYAMLRGSPTARAGATVSMQLKTFRDIVTACDLLLVDKHADTEETVSKKCAAAVVRVASHHSVTQPEIHAEQMYNWVKTSHFRYHFLVPQSDIIYLWSLAFHPADLLSFLDECAKANVL